MKKLDTIEVELSRAKTMIPCMEARIKCLTEDRDAIDEELKNLKALLSDITSALSNRVMSAAELADGGDRKRLPKGAGDTLIYNLLDSNPFESLTMAEISKKTGVNHSTVFRTLNDPKKNNGRFESDKDKKWKLKI